MCCYLSEVLKVLLKMANICEVERCIVIFQCVRNMLVMYFVTM